MASGVTIIYSNWDSASGLGLIHVPAGGSFASRTMTLKVDPNATPVEQALSVTAFDNPVGGGTIVGCIHSHITR